MKKNKAPYAARTYRTISNSAEEAAFQVILDESDLWISCPKKYFAEQEKLPGRVQEKLRHTRAAIKSWMRLQPEFGPSLVPLDVHESAPHIIKRMEQAGKAWQVGPMASVAGAVAEEVAREFMHESPDFIVENGGDIYMASTRGRTVALLPDPANGARIGLKINAGLFPLSVCSSSSTIGHSLSFGNGELVTVLAQNACMADAAATSLCNRLKNPRDLEGIIKEAENSPEILGIFAQCGSRMGLWGDIELVVIDGAG